MQKTVRIGEKDVEMRASAATAIRYRNVFHGDIMKELMALDAENIDMSVVEKIQQVGFIMAKAAESANMAALSTDDYLEWLEQFDQIDIMQAAKDIISVYIHQKESSSDLKKSETETAADGK